MTEKAAKNNDVITVSVFPGIVSDIDKSCHPKIGENQNCIGDH